MGFLADKCTFRLLTRNLSRLFDRPKALQDRVFEKLFRQAEIAEYSEDERRQYEASLKEYWDYTSTMDTAYMKGERKGLEKGRAEGEAKGRAEEKRDTARKMKQKGLPADLIAEMTGLSLTDIEEIG